MLLATELGKPILRDDGVKLQAMLAQGRQEILRPREAPRGENVVGYLLWQCRDSRFLFRVRGPEIGELDNCGSGNVDRKPGRSLRCWMRNFQISES